MLPLPHRYVVTATPAPGTDVELATDDAPTLPTAAPLEFDGPGGRWSPETLLVGAVADCFAITFRGIARVSRLPWMAMTCEAAGVLDRVDGLMRFTEIDLDVSLVVPEGTSEAEAQLVLEKAERRCLITNSLTAAVRLRATVTARTIEVHGVGN